MSEDRRQRTDVRRQRTDVRRQRTDVRRQRMDDRRQMTEVGSQMTEVNEFGSGTRRRPIGRDYAAAKDAEVGRLTQSAWRIA
jgi:hypothetical protein